jgi:hypothetical protein
MEKSKNIDKAKGLELHSEPVQEIMGRPPGWLVRSGIAVIVTVVTLLIIGSYFVSYPELIKGCLIIGQKEQVSQIVFPRNGAGKIKAGQKINVKFDEYPYMEFGIVQLQVPQSEMIPITDPLLGMSYSMEILLLDTLETQYGFNIPCRPGMVGAAEIITDDLSVLDRLLNPIKTVLGR